jgi:N-acetylglucosamine repressor
MKPRKATREQLKRHNRQLVLRAIYDGMADNRAALAQVTGLAKPTVSDLVGELIDEGFVVESGRGESTDSGGKRPTLIKFAPNARQIIGVSVDTLRVFGILSNLNAEITARHYADLNGLQDVQALTILEEVINGLIAQLDAPLLCIGIGVTGVVDSENGVVKYSESLNWREVALTKILSQKYNIPVYIGNNTELTAIAQFAYSQSESDMRNLVTILIDGGVEVGVSWDNAGYHHGRDIGGIHPMTSLDTRLNEFLAWDWIVRRFHELRRNQKTMLPTEGLTYMHLRYGISNSDPIATQLVDDLATNLGLVMAWVIGLLNPSHISLAGEIVDLGDAFLNAVRQKAKRRITPTLVDAVTFSLATTPNLSALGAVAQAMQRELDVI